MCSVLVGSLEMKILVCVQCRVPRAYFDIQYSSLVAQLVKNLPAMQDAWVRSLGQEDPLEEGMATHSSILAWRIPWTEEPGGLPSVGSHRGRHD